MSLTEGLHRGMVIRHEGQVYTVEDFRVAQSGKQKPTVHIKPRDIKTGHPTDRTLEQLGRLDEVPSEMRTMQLLYASGRDRVFMDTETFDQFALGEDMLGDALDLLVEEETYRFRTIDGQVVSLELPDVVALEVVDTAPVEHAGGHTGVRKEAKLAGGLVVHVPLFIKNGDRIRVTTASRGYHGKEH